MDEPISGNSHRNGERVVHFGAFDVNLGAGELRNGGLKIKLHGQPFSVLEALLERPGEVVTREELKQKLWTDETFVDFEHGLNKAINKIREALGDSAENSRFVETLPRRGYRFIAPVVSNGNVSAPVDPVKSLPRWRRVLPWSVAVFAISTLAIFLVWHFTLETGTPQIFGPLTRTEIDLPKNAQLAIGTRVPLEGFDNSAVTFSRDGRYLAYVGQSGSGNVIYLREMAGSAVRPVAGTEGAIYAFFSPDNRWLGFLTDDKVKKVPLDGGAPATLCDAHAPVNATWTPDDWIYFGADEGRILKRVSASGGTAQQVGPQTKLGEVLPTFSKPDQEVSQVFPDGKSALVTWRSGGISCDYADVILVSLVTFEAKILIHSGYAARYVAPNHLLFARSGGLYAVRFDPVREQIQGDPFLISSGVSMESFFGQAHFGASDNGLVAYVPGGDRAIGRLAWIDRQGHTEFLPPPPGHYGAVDLSPKGDRLAVHMADATDYVWLYDLTRNEGRRLTGEEQSGWPIWNPDGATLTFSSWETRDHGWKILALPADGGSPQAVLSATHHVLVASRWSPDGKALALLQPGPFIMRNGKEDGTAKLPDDAIYPDFSPDGRWIAYSSSHSGRWEVFVQSFPGGETVRQISTDGGIEVRWCRCGQLFWRNGNHWMSTAIRTQPKLSWDPPRPSFQTDFIDTPNMSYALSPDGRRLLVVKRSDPDERSRIMVMTNWEQQAAGR